MAIGDNLREEDKAGRRLVLQDLRPGDRFEVAGCPGVTGLLVRLGRGYATVRWDRRERVHSFTTNGGKEVRIKDRGEPQDIATGTVVEFRGRDLEALKAKTEKERRTMEAALTVRWIFQLKNLKKEVGEENEEAAEGIRERIGAIAREAEAAGVKLPRPSGALADIKSDPVFDGLEEVMMEEELVDPHATTGLSPLHHGIREGEAAMGEEGDGDDGGGNVEEAVEDVRKETAKVNQRVKKNKAAGRASRTGGQPESQIEEDEAMATKAKTKANGRAKANGKAKAARTKGGAEKELHDCLCGCGERVTGKFRMGHDSRYKSFILKVERGEIKQTELPAKMRKELTFDSKNRCTNPQAQIKH